ncbi:MAG: hypothetical protein WBG73_00480 [Coleofasciculaceae cyanobacterium]
MVIFWGCVRVVGLIQRFKFGCWVILWLIKPGLNNSIHLRHKKLLAHLLAAHGYGQSDAAAVPGVLVSFRHNKCL